MGSAPPPPPPPPPPPGPDTTPPQTTIASGPPSSTTETTATFAPPRARWARPSSAPSTSARSSPVCPRSPTARWPWAPTSCACAPSILPERRSHACCALLDDRGGSASAPAASAGRGLLCLQTNAEDCDGDDPAGGTATLAVAAARFASPASLRRREAMNTDAMMVRGGSGSVERLVVDQSAGRSPRARRQRRSARVRYRAGGGSRRPDDQFAPGGTAGADLLSAGTKGVSFTPRRTLTSRSSAPGRDRAGRAAQATTP